MHHLVWVAGIVLIMTGCATKDFVNETISKQRTEVDQRIDKVEGQVGESSQRIGSVEGKVTDQGQRVEGIHRTRPLVVVVRRGRDLRRTGRDRGQGRPGPCQRRDGTRGQCHGAGR